MNRIEGCKIDVLSTDDCYEIITAITAPEKKIYLENGFNWALAHCHDGVTWGKYVPSDQIWQFASTLFPEICPEISQNNLLELRLFGEKSEILLWRTKQGFLGRQITDDTNFSGDSPTRPEKETRILLGNRLVETRDGFACVSTASAKEQVIPLECSAEDFKNNRWPLRLTIRNYFDQDTETGMVRIAATRLIKIFMNEVH